MKPQILPESVRAMMTRVFGHAEPVGRLPEGWGTVAHLSLAAGAQIQQRPFIFSAVPPIFASQLSQGDSPYYCIASQAMITVCVHGTGEPPSIADQLVLRTNFGVRICGQRQSDAYVGMSDGFVTGALGDRIDTNGATSISASSSPYVKTLAAPILFTNSGQGDEQRLVRLDTHNNVAVASPAGVTLAGTLDVYLALRGVWGDYEELVGSSYQNPVGSFDNLMNGMLGGFRQRAPYPNMIRMG